MDPDPGKTESQSGDVQLTSFDPDGHRLLLASWLKRAHVQRWWGDPGQNLHEAIHPGAGVGQSLVLYGDRPVGYLYWQRLASTELTALGLKKPPYGAVEVDVLIGEDAFRGKGIATRALQALIRELAGTQSVPLLVLCTSVDNRAAVRAYEKAGFTKSHQYEDAEWGPCWLLVSYGEDSSA